MLEGLENEAREAKKGLWVARLRCRRGSGGSANRVSGQAYLLALPRLESTCFGLSGTRIVGQNKAGYGCTLPLYFWVENTFSSRTLPHSALFSPAGHATAKHQRSAARLDEKGIAGVFDALYLFVSLQRDRMKPIHKR